jgi:hypothetical protein
MDATERSKLITALTKASEHAVEEAFSASAKFAPFNSAHEGYAVAQEEVDELWDHVKTNQNRRDISAMRREAIQCAAMFLRFVVDICDNDRGRV